MLPPMGFSPLASTPASHVQGSEFEFHSGPDRSEIQGGECSGSQWVQRCAVNQPHFLTL